MTAISRIALFGKLCALPYRAIESATGLAKLRGNAYVELAHWLDRLLQQPDSDIICAVRHFDIDPDSLVQDVVRTLDRLPRGATAVTDFSPHIEEMIERGWVIATLRYGQHAVRSGHLLLACLGSPALQRTLLGVSAAFGRIRPDALADEFDTILAHSPEAAATPEAASAGPATPSGGQVALQRFATDLTARARRGDIDPVIGRDHEIRQAIDVLLRRRQNNPIFVGEAGVGKTAIVEGLALRIAHGDVPPPLRNVTIHTLDLGLLQAGATARGEFEQRLNQVVQEVQASPTPIVLFIDEAHTLIGAGGGNGTGDAANLLKPALARGSLRTIAATTWAEYKRHIEKDPALTRRFQAIAVDEPDEPRAVEMMRAVTKTLERHHRVEILDEAVQAAVALSDRYIPARQLPDKCLAVLDTACARVAVSQHAMPPEIENARQRIATLETSLGILRRELAVGEGEPGRESEILSALADARAALHELDARRAREAALVRQAQGLRQRLREPALDAAEAELLRRTLRDTQAGLSAVQGEHPLVLATVDRAAVAGVVQDWTGIPVGRMLRDEVATVLSLDAALAERVVGQDHALQQIARRIQISRAGLANPARPIGVFLLCGPSGVGKTETALALADLLYGGRQSLITINMSEFQEAHSVSGLKGAPPGYVGHGEGGVLTEAVRRRPHCVVLLDEIEKAHPDVHELFFQVFDAGEMEDGDGRRIDFRNTLILLTSNVGGERIAAMCRDPARVPSAEALAGALRNDLLSVFPPALLGRLVSVPYYPLSDAMIGAIIRLQLERIGERLGQVHGIGFRYDDAVVALVAARCREVESGGRMIDAILTNTLLPEISRKLLQETMHGGTTGQVGVGVEDDAFRFDFVPDERYSADRPWNR
jgi:type VI secretion system protein VasG